MIAEKEPIKLLMNNIQQLFIFKNTCFFFIIKQIRY